MPRETLYCVNSCGEESKKACIHVHVQWIHPAAHLKLTQCLLEYGGRSKLKKKKKEETGKHTTKMGKMEALGWPRMSFGFSIL